MRALFVGFLLLWMTLHTSAQALPFAEAEVDNATPYIGQAIVYTLRVYTTEEIENSTVIEPSFFGFGRSSELADVDTYTETIGATTYSVIEQPYILYPLRSGDLTIDPFRIEIPETPFRDELTIFNDAITINVQNYPEPRPATFINAVGQFDITSEAEPTDLSSGDALTLTVTVSGMGNIEQLLAPIVPLPEGWRLFDARTHFEQNNLRFGTKTFTWTVIVNDVGDINLPAIEFSFLNPQSGQYESRRTTPIALNIVPASPSPVITVERTLIVLTDVPIPDLMTTSEQTLLPPRPPVWFWSIWLIPPLLTFAVWFVGRPKQTRRQVRRQRARKQSGKRPLNALRNALRQTLEDEPKIAYQNITGAIYAYLSKKSGQAVGYETYHDVIAKYPKNYRDELATCIEEASQGQYAPVTRADVRVLSQRVLRVCSAIERVS